MNLVLPCPVCYSVRRDWYEVNGMCYLQHWFGAMYCSDGWMDPRYIE
jgi:hypothetical protein